MEDFRIIDLYWQRDETAIVETDRKYGVFCYSVSKNILSRREDAEECVNDTYRQAWDSMPPQRPERLRAWLGKIVRNLSLNRWNKNHAQKRYSGMERLLSELEDCIPAPEAVEKQIEGRELTEFLNRWLSSLSTEDRVLFLCRYWNGDAVKALAKERGVSQGTVSQKLYRLRQSLKTMLEKEGYSL